MVDLAAWALAFPTDTAAAQKLLAAQGCDGGWGVRSRRPAEVFDTAIALLALGGKNAKAHEFLIGRQLENGSWPETTRPAGAQSYAHAISTSAWAAMALLGRQDRLVKSRGLASRKQRSRLLAAQYYR